jgi:hypothetical protein
MLLSFDMNPPAVASLLLLFASHQLQSAERPDGVSVPAANIPALTVHYIAN